MAQPKKIGGPPVYHRGKEFRGAYNFLERYDKRGETYSLKEEHRDPALEDVLMLMTGGTIAQVADETGELNPFEGANLRVLENAPRLSEHANIDVVDFGAVDSTNLCLFKRRAEFAKIVFRNRDYYSGFVITHGTDSMDVTAASMALMVQDLGKPVVLTGSQYPIYDDPTDAYTNLTGAVIASTMPIGETVLYFGGFLYRGVGIVKVREENPVAFDTPNYPVLGEWSLLGDEKTGKKLKVNWDIVIPKNPNTDPRLFIHFNEDVEYHELQLGGSFRSIKNALKSKTCKGVVIGGVGAGNVSDQLIPYIERAVNDQAKPVWVTTRCLTGSAQMGSYGPGAAAKKAGAHSAHNLTGTLTVVKLAHVIGRVDKEIEAGDTKPEQKLRRIEQLMNREVAKEFGGRRVQEYSV